MRRQKRRAVTEGHEHRDDLSGVALITGASGFIGRHVRSALLERGVDVVAIRRSSSPEPSEGRSVVADYADPARLAEIVADERPDYVFHVAGATKGVTYEDFARANVMPTENLIRALESTGHPLRRFVLVSSLAAYGPTEPGRPVSEASEPRPVEHYGKSKLAAEKVLRDSTLSWTILRPGGVYGPGDVDYFEAFKAAAKGWNVFLGNRQRTFSAVYVDDLVDATLLAATHPRAERRAYFIDDGHPVSWEAFQRVVCDHAGRKTRDVDLPEVFVSFAAWGGEWLTRLDQKPRLMNRQKAMMGAQPAWECSSEAAVEELGYRPKVDLETGVRRAFEWYRSAGWV